MENLSFLYGKATGQLVRLSGACHVLNVANNLMISYKEEIFVKHQLVDRIEDRLTLAYVNYIKRSSSERNISINDVTTAYGLNLYFINQKRIMAGYQKEGLDTEIKSRSSLEKPTNSLERKILLSPGPVVLLTSLSKKHLCKKIEFEKTCKKLQNLQLGTLGKVKISTKESICFTKTFPNESIDFINNLMEYFVDFEEYSIAYKISDE